MNLPMVNAYIEGYQDHLFDLKCIAVYQGFWTGYYSNTKKPKSLTTVLTTLHKDHLKSKKRRSKNTDISKPREEVNVEQFLERERKRLKLKPNSERG